MTKDEAIQFFDRKPSKLAAALGINPASVSQWIEIPMGRQYQIELLTDGKLKADDKQQAA